MIRTALAMTALGGLALAASAQAVDYRVSGEPDRSRYLKVTVDRPTPESEDRLVLRGAGIGAVPADSAALGTSHAGTAASAASGSSRAGPADSAALGLQRDGTAASAPSGVSGDCSGLASPSDAVSTDVRVARVTLDGVPAMLRIPRRVTQPPVLLWHGFGPPASEEELMRALPLDEVPAVKVYLGLPLFGARQLAGGMQELARRQQEDVALQVFEPIVMGAAGELSKVVEALAKGQCMRTGDAVALVGFSAGGASVLAALAERRVPIDAAVTLNASTGLSDSVAAYERATGKSYEWSPRSRALASRSDAAKRSADIARNTPALLMIHGQEDPMLPAENARKLYDVLRPFYAKAGVESRLQLSVVPGLAHSIAPPPAANGSPQASGGIGSPQSLGGKRRPQSPGGNGSPQSSGGSDSRIAEALNQQVAEWLRRSR